MKVSVLMSVYNESEEEISLSIESILNQTLKDIELIIVNDNPINNELNYILDYYRKLDNRIVLIKNEVNLGLALSLNKASNIAKAPFLARMDADDISNLTRLSKQYEIMKTEDYDLTCTNYSFIDEKSNYIERKVENYSSEQINNLLPLDNVIHHPTVMMKKIIFKELKGYRNFLSAQDYDLWLRFHFKGCKFYMINEKLLKYRIRSESVSLRNRAQQVSTITYIRNQYLKRLKTGKDAYSYSSYLKYLEKGNSLDVENNKGVNYYFNLLVKAQDRFDRKEYIKGLLLKLKVFLRCRILRKEYISKIKMKAYLNLMNFGNSKI